MFKHNKLFVSVLLVAVIVAGMVVPAFASVTGSGTLGSYSYTWEVANKTSYGNAKITNSGQPTELTAKVRNHVTYDLHDYTGYTDWNTVTGYASASATRNNIITINDVKVRAVIDYTQGSFWVGSTCVASYVLAD